MESQHLIIFWVAVVLGLPLSIFLCRLSKTFMYLFFTLMIFSLVAPRWSITFLSHEIYKSATRGFEIHIADLIAIILFLSMLFRREEFKIRWLPPLMIPMLLYFAIGWISWAMIGRDTMPIYDIHYQDEDVKPIPYFELTLYPLFEIAKIGRGIFIFWVVFNFMQDKRAYKYLVVAFSAIILCITGMELYGRYVQGLYRPDFGGFQFNDINTLVGLLSLTIFPLAYVTRSFLKSSWYWMMVGCGCLTIILTVSRSSLAGFIFGVLFIIIWMIIRYPTAKNIAITAFAAFIGFLLFLKAADTLMVRFNEKSIDEDMIERIHLDDAAYLMGKEHFFGVGLGNFSAWEVNSYGQRADANPYNIPHNIWFLTFAELGYLGIIFFVLIWVRFYQMLFSGIRIFGRFDNWKYGFPLLLGILAASIVIQFQNRFHFTYRQTSVYFIMHILSALAARAYADRRVTLRKYIDSRPATQSN